MANRDRLPTKIDALQNQCWLFVNGEWVYTGFRCPDDNSSCDLKSKIDSYDDPTKAVADVYFELDHIDGKRMCETGTTYPEQVVVRCSACHTQRHRNDGSASRLKRT